MAVIVLSKRDRDRLSRKACSFCETRLTNPARGHCGSLFGASEHCGWVRAFRAFGIEEALRLSKLPHGDRPKLPPVAQWR